MSAELTQRLARAGQTALARHLEALPAEAGKGLAADLATIDLDQVAALVRNLGQGEEASGDVEPFPAVKEGDDPGRDAEARTLGERLLREGRVAAFVVAGGQGTRLGHAGPKGTYPATPLTGKPLFRVFAEKLLALGRRYGKPVPFFVMTSPLNHEDTVRFFADHGHFGLAEEQVAFFSQGTMPAVTEAGELILSDGTTLFRSPDGHGGSLRALHTSGSLERMAKDGIDHIFYFQVDNPLVTLCDPYFVGLHALTESQYSCKVVRKREPGEKVGVVARRGGKPCVIEYSDLPEALRNERDEDGVLRYKEGSVAIHVLDRRFVESLNEGAFGLPFHEARKKIPAWRDGALAEVEGIKFETFVFDALPKTTRALVLEVPREAEFSPIKNKEGSDSAASSRADQVALHARWLEQVGVQVPRREDGSPTHAVEISPLFADSVQALAERRSDLPTTVGDDLLLEAE